MTTTTIALDAMGGDYGPRVVIPAAVRIMQENSDVRLLLVGDQSKLLPILKTASVIELKHQYEIVHATESIAMDESPAQALRTKKDASMRIAVDLVKEGRAQACVSAGNTGALMAIARFVLKTLPGIDRPAIIATIPIKNNKTVRILDLGANLNSSPENLYQLGVMGSILCSASYNMPHPRVGLLNVGEEEIKGNELVKKASVLFEESDVIQYIGYVEGNTLFEGVADVIVCDGFVGNIMLKACEGMMQFIMESMNHAFRSTLLSRLSALPAMPILKKLNSSLDPAKHNGATLIGLNGIVIKSHGSADSHAFAYAIQEAVLEVDNNIPALIKEKISATLTGLET